MPTRCWASTSIPSALGASKWVTPSRCRPRGDRGGAGNLSVVSAYRIRTYGDPVLRQRASEVVDIDGSTVALVEQMFPLMYDAPGIGLAATQVGVGRRLFVYDIGDDPQVIVNPVITESRGEWEFDEGCLSIPGLSLHILRPKEVHITGYDLHGREVDI